MGTFLYSLIALRRVRGDDGPVDLFIPGITIGIAFVLAVASVAMFVY